MIITHRKKSVRSAVSIPSKPVIAEDDGYDGEYWGWDGDRWLEDFYKEVEAEVADKFQSMVWNSDDENVYLDVADKDGVVTQYTIPFEDLSFNFNKMDESVEYVVEEILSDLPVESSVKASAELQESGESFDANDIIRTMYNKFPDMYFIDERDMSGNNVALYFELSDSYSDAVEFLDTLGVNYKVSNGVLRIIAPESPEYMIHEDNHEFYDMGTGLEYWYFTTHGVQPGSVPKGLEILDVIDKPEGSYFLTNRVISTDALKYYDIKERSPR